MSTKGIHFAGGAATMHTSTGAAVVLCVGVPLHEVTRIAQNVGTGTVVLAAGDTATAQALLESVEAPADPPDVGRGGAGDGPASRRRRSRDRRSDRHRATASPDVIRAGQLTIDVPAREVHVAGDPVHLSAREFDLLALLASDPFRVWSFSTLVRAVWGTEYLGDHDQLTSTVKRLRKRLGPHSGCELHSVHGVGYRLRVDEAPVPDWTTSPTAVGERPTG
jgi:DNA-binding winged helix-turn-helix (wHTH) protein